jgi:hypothetical protein
MFALHDLSWFSLRLNAQIGSRFHGNDKDRRASPRPASYKFSCIDICLHADGMEPSAVLRIEAVTGRHSSPPVRDR